MSRFTQTLHITTKPESGIVCLSIATSEGRVDEITLPESHFKAVAHDIWEKSSTYGNESNILKAKFKAETGIFSLSVQTGLYTRSVYRLAESEVMPTIGQYIANVGGE